MTSSSPNPALSGRIISTFLYYLVPSIIGLMAITTANIIDGMFLGKFVGDNALAVITLLIPYITLLIAIALMLAIGGSVRAGKYVGENNLRRASAIFSMSLIATVFITLLFTLSSVFFETQLYRAMHIPRDMYSLANQYFGVIRWAMNIQLLTMVLYYFVRADGHPILATTALVCGAFINIGLDALFIIHMDMGIAGAAYATCVAQFIQFCILASYFFSSRRLLRFSFIDIKWKELWISSYYGVSEFINEISVGLIFLLINGLVVSRHGAEGVAAFSVANYFIFLSVMMYYGIADALHLLISQNYGAKNRERIKQFFQVCLITTVAFSSILISLTLLGRETVVTWFLDESSSDTSAAAEILFLIWPLFLVNGININLSAYFTAIQNPKASAIIAVTRSLIFPAGLLVTFFYTFHYLTPIIPIISDWTFIVALPAAEWCTFVLAGICCYRYRNVFHSHRTDALLNDTDHLDNSFEIKGNSCKSHC